jgi:hypothetical protein
LYSIATTNLEGWNIFQQSKANLLYLIGSTNLIMDYLAKVIDDGAVESLPSHDSILVN